MSIYTHKMVDGVEVLLTPEEIAELEARDAAWEALEPIREAKRQRDAAIANDPERNELIALLRDGTIAQINTWVDDHVGGAPTVRHAFKVLLKMLANATSA